MWIWIRVKYVTEASSILVSSFLVDFKNKLSEESNVQTDRKAHCHKRLIGNQMSVVVYETIICIFVPDLANNKNFQDYYFLP